MGGLLIDTHILLWMRLTPSKLAASERRIIDSTFSRYVSAISLWEIAILLGLKRIRSESSANGEDLFDTPAGFELLPVLSAHCRTYRHLPMRHRDPFDRMLIAQASSEGLAIVSRDVAFAAYREDGLDLVPSGD